MTSHYLNQWWLVYWCIYASLSLNELMLLCIEKEEIGSALIITHDQLADPIIPIFYQQEFCSLQYHLPTTCYLRQYIVVNSFSWLYIWYASQISNNTEMRYETWNWEICIKWLLSHMISYIICLNIYYTTNLTSINYTKWNWLAHSNTYEVIILANWTHDLFF